MASLLETNPYLRDPETRRRMLEEDTYQSSVYEGARGLPRPAQSSTASKRRSMAARGKRVKLPKKSSDHS